MEYKANPNVKRPAPPTNNTRSPKRRKALANDPTDMDANNLEKTAGQPDGPNIQKTILSNLETGAYSDLTIRDKDGKEYRVHKHIVCTRCDFFAKAVEGGFKESVSHLIEMNNDSPAALKTLIEYLYTDDYSNPYGSKSLDTVMLHLDAYIIGEIYGVTGLKAIARAAFHKIIATDKSLCPAAAIPLCVERIYESIPEVVPSCKMKTSIAMASVIHLSGLLQDPDFTDKMASIPAFAEDLGKAILHLDRKQVSKCVSCRDKAEGKT
ncbi:hypothetical protein IWZ00DRAFT_548124 [Phyllosticta capitalensis]|uniref:BTB domain-containing protein n=1 Tax=Phyllosticta capitalensis TaxID=121624 RepID=A0ABR1YIK9_9PEZI